MTNQKTVSGYSVDMYSIPVPQKHFARTTGSKKGGLMLDEQTHVLNVAYQCMTDEDRLMLVRFAQTCATENPRNRANLFQVILGGNQGRDIAEGSKRSSQSHHLRLLCISQSTKDCDPLCDIIQISN